MNITKKEAKQALKDIWYRAMTCGSVMTWDFTTGKRIAKKRYQEKHDMLDKLIEDYFKMSKEKEE